MAYPEHTQTIKESMGFTVSNVILYVHCSIVPTQVDKNAR